MKKQYLTLCFFWVNCLLINAQVPNLAPSIENCDTYLENAEWLPDAFIVNATCACIMTPNELKANIVRQVLQERLANVSDSLKQQAIEKKQQYLKHQIGRKKYNRFVKQNLTPVIYKNHVFAYQSATCKGDPAPYWAWKIVTTHRFNNCKIVWAMIRYGGGSCSDCWGKW